MKLTKYGTGAAEQFQSGGGWTAMGESKVLFGDCPQKIFWDHALYIIGKCPFLTRFATLHPYLYTVCFWKDFNNFEKRHYDGQQN